MGTLKYNLTLVRGLHFELTDTWEDKEYNVVFLEKKDDGKIIEIYSTNLKKGHWAKLNRRYLSNIIIEIWDKIDPNAHILKERINVKNQLKGKRVFITFESKSLGDTIAWIPYCLEFKKTYECDVIVSSFINEMFESVYPELEFVPRGTVVNNITAMFELGWWYHDDFEPVYPGIIPLQQAATNILGLPFEEIKPRIAYKPKKRPIKEKYIAISTRSTSQAKHWDYWQDLINYLITQGYKVVLFKIDPTYSDYNVPPLLTFGTPYTMVDYTNPLYQYSGTLGACFLSSTKIAYSFKESMNNTYFTVIGDVSGLTVSSIGSPVEFSNSVADSLQNVSTAVYPMPINGQQYIVYVGVPTLGTNSGNIICGIGKVTGTTILFSTPIVLAYNNAGVDITPIGYFAGAGMVVFTPSSVLNGVALANLFWFNASSSGYGYFKTSTINYINKVFTNQNLLGIAQNTVTTSATVNVLPFGNVDDNQSGLVAGTSYYLQDNGVITTNVTPTPLGTALSAALIKTVNYPTI